MQGLDYFGRVSLEITEATGEQHPRLRLGGGAGGDAGEADVFGGSSALYRSQTGESVTYDPENHPGKGVIHEDYCCGAIRC